MVDRLVARTFRLVPALVSAFALVYPFASSGQTVSGTVREKSSQAGVGDAVVILFDADKKLRSAVRSTPQGTYMITAPSPGLYSLSVQKSGLTTINTEIFHLFGTSSIVRDFEAVISPPTLATVTVKGKPVVNSAGPNSHKYDQFLLRRNLGIGTFLTREQIEAKPATQTPQLFQSIAGLKVTQRGTQWLIHSQRCASKLEGGGRDATMDEDNPALFPILFIDGFRVKGLGILNDLNPSDIEGIEVYQGAAQLPAEAKGNACAAIFVWLRQLH